MLSHSHLSGLSGITPVSPVWVYLSSLIIIAVVIFRAIGAATVSVEAPTLITDSSCHGWNITQQVQRSLARSDIRSLLYFVAAVVVAIEMSTTNARYVRPTGYSNLIETLTVKTKAMGHGTIANCSCTHCKKMYRNRSIFFSEAGISCTLQENVQK